MGMGRARTAARGPTVVGSCRSAAARRAQDREAARLGAVMKAACRVRVERDQRRSDPAPVPPEQLAIERQILSVARAAAVGGSAARAAAIARLAPSLVSRVRRLAVHGDPA